MMETHRQVKVPFCRASMQHFGRLARVAKMSLAWRSPLPASCVQQRACIFNARWAGMPRHHCLELVASVRVCIAADWASFRIFNISYSVFVGSSVSGPCWSKACCSSPTVVHKVGCREAAPCAVDVAGAHHYRSQWETHLCDSHAGWTPRLSRFSGTHSVLIFVSTMRHQFSGHGSGPNSGVTFRRGPVLEQKTSLKYGTRNV